MKDQDNKMTLQEIEQLCRLYLDCHLSVLEEMELEYVLSQVDYHSPLIDDVRTIIGFFPSESTCKQKSDIIIKRPFRKNRMFQIGAAASVAILLCLGIILFGNISDPNTTSKQDYYIAYADGKRLNDKEAKILIQQEISSADEFIRNMGEIEKMEMEMINNFETLNNFEE
ncbi:MAG: hypothetical protein K2K29_07435 [Muribaculaceae bacterium]|nr:hypothetical protein [Muribaculaceae bacterium]